MQQEKAIFYMTSMEKNCILLLHLKIGKQAKGKCSYLKNAMMLPTINCDITKAATNVTSVFSFFHKKWQKYLVTLKDFLRISYYKIQLLIKICIFSKILLLQKESILIQDPVTDFSI